MDTMKALVVYADGSAKLENVPSPSFGDYEALVRVQASALCGTDMKILHNKLKGYTDYPTILGHEGVGEVVAVGKKVRNFHVGDRVVLPYILQKCGDYFSTWGAICEYSTVGDSTAMVEDGLEIDEITLHEFNFAQRTIPRTMDPVAATMIVTFREVYSTMKRLGFHGGQNIVIYGAGPVGLTFVRLARHIGMHPIVMIDTRDDKVEQALAMGADYGFNSKRSDVSAEIRKLFPAGADILLDAAGVPELINDNLKLVRDYGQVCVYGVTPENYLQMRWQEAPYNFDLRFAQWPSKKEEAAVHDEVVAMMESGVLDGMEHISDVFELKDAEKAIKFFEERKNAKKIVIRM